MPLDSGIPKTVIVRKNQQPGPTWIGFLCGFDEHGYPTPGNAFAAVGIDCVRGSQAWLCAVDHFGLREQERTRRPEDPCTLTTLSKTDARRLWERLKGKASQDF